VARAELRPRLFQDETTIGRFDAEDDVGDTPAQRLDARRLGTKLSDRPQISERVVRSEFEHDGKDKQFNHGLHGLHGWKDPLQQANRNEVRPGSNFSSSYPCDPCNPWLSFFLIP